MVSCLVVIVLEVKGRVQACAWTSSSFPGPFFLDIPVNNVPAFDNGNTCMIPVFVVDGFPSVFYTLPRIWLRVCRSYRIDIADIGILFLFQHILDMVLTVASLQMNYSQRFLTHNSMAC